MQTLQPALYCVSINIQLLGQLLTELLECWALLGQELVERGVQETDGYRVAVHGTEDALKVLQCVAEHKFQCSQTQG